MTDIETKYLGPTNFRGARVKARAGNGAGSLTLSWDHAIDSEENHYAAARALILKLEWFHDPKRGDRYGRWYGAGKDTGYVFVCATDYSELTREPRRKGRS